MLEKDILVQVNAIDGYIADLKVMNYTVNQTTLFETLKSFKSMQIFLHNFTQGIRFPNERDVFIRISNSLLEDDIKRLADA